MRVIVTGSRTWDSEWCRTLVYNELDRLESLDHMRGESIVVVHGACKAGADRFVADWLKLPRNSVEKAYPADWDKYGKKAGRIRNQQMADDGADLCLAFWNGSSKGTAHMIECATKAGIIVKIIPAPRYAPKADSTSSKT